MPTISSSGKMVKVWSIPKTSTQQVKDEMLSNISQTNHASVPRSIYISSPPSSSPQKQLAMLSMQESSRLSWNISVELESSSLRNPDMLWRPGLPAHIYFGEHGLSSISL